MSLDGLDKWLTTTPEDLAHNPECNCEECHDWHVREGMVTDNAGDVDFRCCADELESMIHDGKVCPKHPKAYFEPAGGKRVTTCAKCGSSSVPGSDVCQAHGGLTDKRPAFCEDCDEEKIKNTGGVV